MNFLSVFISSGIIRSCTGLLSGCMLLAGCASAPTDVEYARAFRVYRGDGSPATLSELLAAAREVEVTFLGEQHDDPVAHYLEERILRESWEPSLLLSLEMFETDVQYVLDEYLAGQISEEHLKRSARAWPAYDSDYRPLIEFAKEKKMPVLAANAPRRYVNMITRLGEDSLLELGEQARATLPPLPHAKAGAAYAEKFLALMEAQGAIARDEKNTASGTGKQAGSIDEESDGGTDDAETAQTAQDADARQSGRPDPQRMLRAQSMWDASMAWSISEALKAGDETRVIHVNGSFHSARRMGIPDHLLRYRPGTSFLVVTMLDGESFPDFDPASMRDQGDYVIVTDPRY